MNIYKNLLKDLLNDIVLLRVFFPKGKLLEVNIVSLFIKLKNKNRMKKIKSFPDFFLSLIFTNLVVFDNSWFLKM